MRSDHGAMMRFKEQTGKEVTELDGSSFSDLCTYLWCCVVSACSRESGHAGHGPGSAPDVERFRRLARRIG